MGDPTIKTVADLEAIEKDPVAKQESLIRVLAGELKDEVRQTVREEVQSQFETINRREKLTRRLPMAGADYNPKAPGAELDGQFKNFGEYLQVMGKHRNSNRRYPFYGAKT